VVVCACLQLGLDALKSATLLAWLKDAGFYALKNVSTDVSVGSPSTRVCTQQVPTWEENAGPGSYHAAPVVATWCHNGSTVVAS